MPHKNSISQNGSKNLQNSHIITQNYALILRQNKNGTLIKANTRTKSTHRKRRKKLEPLSAKEK
jgi:hypothetical protein